MIKKGECGVVLHTHYNRTKAEARAEMAVEAMEAEGCRAEVSVFIHSENELVEAYGLAVPAGPDLYTVPPGGRLEVKCGAISEEPHDGSCKVEWTFRWF